MALPWLIDSRMHQPRLLDQMITSVYALRRDRKRKAIKEATARMHPLDLLRLTEHLDSLVEPIAYVVTEGESEEDFTVDFIFDKIDWTCIPDANIPEGAPLIILHT